MDKMNDNIAKLLTLIHNNPDLPVICMVDCKVVYEDSGRWMASIGYCYVGEYACYNERYYDDREEFTEDYYDHNDEILNTRFGYNPRMAYPDAAKRYKKEDIEANKAAEEQLNKYLEETTDKAFRRAIIVNIDTPDVDLVEEIEDIKGEK